MLTTLKKFTLLICLVATVSSQSVFGAVLPEDRADVLYHGYDGGGMDITGPSILVRKSIGNRVSVWGNYYEDILSSASVDVLTQGSPYEEERTEYSLGADYLHNKTLMSLSITKSDENDYEAETVGFAISQDFFGDLTTLSLKYSIGNDDVYRNVREDGQIIDRDFIDTAEHRRYGVALTQIITRNLIASLSAETVIDEGFLNNPYRSFRAFDTIDETSITTREENYPRTRSSDAFSIRALYYLPYRAAIKSEYRTFTDSWGITSDNYELKYVHPYKQWKFEIKYRVYSQSEAVFFYDVVPNIDFVNQEFFASDKELDAFTNTNIGFGVSYEIKSKWLSWFEKSTANFYWDNMSFEYDNYRDRTLSLPDPETNEQLFARGQEPLYQFEANVIRVFFSFWY